MKCGSMMLYACRAICMSFDRNALSFNRVTRTRPNDQTCSRSTAVATSPPNCVTEATSRHPERDSLIFCRLRHASYRNRPPDRRRCADAIRTAAERNQSPRRDHKRMPTAPCVPDQLQADHRDGSLHRMALGKALAARSMGASIAA